MLRLNLKPPILCMQCRTLPMPGSLLTLNMSWYTMVIALSTPLVSYCPSLFAFLYISSARAFS